MKTQADTLNAGITAPKRPGRKAGHKALLESGQLLHRLRIVREAAPLYGPAAAFMGKPVSCSRDLWEMFKDYHGALDREELQVLALNTKNRICGWHTLSTGTLNSSIVHPRDLFKFAVLANAGSLIILHNHPSGDSVPSAEDDLLTYRLSDAGKILGIPLLDHVVCGEFDWYSYADHGKVSAK